MSSSKTNTSKGPLEKLTRRQEEVLMKAIRGLPSKVIARELGIEVPTVKAHLNSCFRAFGVKNRTELVYAAAKLGLTAEENKTTAEPVESIDTLTKPPGPNLFYILFVPLSLVVAFLFVDNYILEEDTPATGTLISNETPPMVPDRRSIAVLPFVNRSNDEEDVFFVDGIHDDIITQLAKISSLKVISRTSVMGYRDTTKNIRTIAKELGVGTLLEGGVQRAGDRVRINVQLIDTSTDEHLWAESYNRELTAINIFQIQEQIATQITTALQATLSAEEEDRLRTIPTDNMDALEAYFHAKQYMADRTSDGLGRAIDEFQRAIELDPEFALAYIGLADVAILENEYRGLSLRARRESIEDYINQALALDDGLGEAYTSRGWLYANLRYPEEAEAAFKRAMELSPNYSTAYHWYGEFIVNLARPEEAATALNKAVELDPYSPIINYARALALHGLGRFEESRDLFENLINIAPQSPLGYWGLTQHYWMVSGRLDEAARWHRQISEIDSATPVLNFFYANVLLELGDDIQSVCWVNETQEAEPDSYYTYLALQHLHLYQGNETQTLDYAEKVITTGGNLFMDKYTTMSIALLRNHDLALGNIADAREQYALYYPELLEETRPEINNLNYRAAVDLALVLQGSGETDRAEYLLRESLAYIQDLQRLGMFGFFSKDVEIYALQGETAKALEALRNAIDEGWRFRWRYSLEINPNLDSIRDEPAFQAMVEEVRTDMADQLTGLRQTEPSEQICSGA